MDPITINTFSYSLSIKAEPWGGGSGQNHCNHEWEVLWREIMLFHLKSLLCFYFYFKF